MPAAFQLVHAVDARLELHAGDLELALLLQRLDLEWRTPPLDLQPFAGEAREPLPLELGVTSRQSHFSNGGLRRLRDHRSEVLLQVGVRAHARPDLAHKRMQELSA